MQVAGVNKPLVATIDMVEADNVVLLTKTGGVAKKISDEDLKRIMRIIKDAKGHQIRIERKGRKHVIEITVPKKENNKAQVDPGKKNKQGDRMDVDLFLRPAWRV